jgi:hypothetical protein
MILTENVGCNCVTMCVFFSFQSKNEIICESCVNVLLLVFVESIPTETVKLSRSLRRKHALVGY